MQGQSRIPIFWRHSVDARRFGRARAVHDATDRADCRPCRDGGGGDGLRVAQIDAETRRAHAIAALDDARRSGRTFRIDVPQGDRPPDGSQRMRRRQPDTGSSARNHYAGAG